MRRVIRIRHYRASAALGLCAVLLLSAAKVGFLPALNDLLVRFEYLAYDIRMRSTLTAREAADPRVVIVDIDERSLAAVGQWPWPREVVGRLVEQLGQYQVAVIGFDIVFAEPERNPVLEVLEGAGDRLGPTTRHELELVVERLDGDLALLNALSRYPVVLGYAFLRDLAVHTGGRPGSVLKPPQPINAALLDLHEMNAYVSNLARFQAVAAGEGFYTAVPDPDGVVRSVPVLVKHGGDVLPSLPLEIFRIFVGAEDVLFESHEVGDNVSIEAIWLDDFWSVPLGLAGHLRIPFRGPEGTYTYVSAIDVLNNEVDAGGFEGTIALVGTTAEGLYDLRATPVSSVFPGVEVQANVISSLLDQEFIVEPPWAPALNLLLVLGAGAILALVLPLLGPKLLVVVSITLSLAYTVFNYWLWLQYRFVIDLAAPNLMFMMVAFINLGSGFFYEALARRKLKSVFEHYLPPARVQEMAHDPEGDYAVDGESRELTVLFCDIRNFTAIAEILVADDVKRMLNAYLTPMTRIIFDHKGTIDKYVGDMIIAFWGAPVIDPDHRRNAVAAAMAMLNRLQALQPVLLERGWPSIDIGIGVNSGMMNVGDMGSDYRREYTVIGDAVNLGSRLEGLTKYYGARLIVSEFTKQGLDDILMRPLDIVRVKGKKDPVRIYEPVAPRKGVQADVLRELEQYNKARETYLSRQWDAAINLFERLHVEFGDRRVYRIHIERAQQFREEGVPVSWDGTFGHVNK
jgi:adenylate cyclase